MRPITMQEYKHLHAICLNKMGQETNREVRDKHKAVLPVLKNAYELKLNPRTYLPQWCIDTIEETRHLDAENDAPEPTPAEPAPRCMCKHNTYAHTNGGPCGLCECIEFAERITTDMRQTRQLRYAPRRTRLRPPPLSEDIAWEDMTKQERISSSNSRITRREQSYVVTADNPF